MKRSSNFGRIGCGMLLGAVAAIHGTTENAHAAEVLTLSDVRVVYEHTAFDGTPPDPMFFDPPATSLLESAYYSLRGLSINPTGGSTGGPSVYTSWLHGFGSRWILEQDLIVDPLDSTKRIVDPDPTHAARLFSDFTTRQSQPKSVAIDNRGNIYTPIRNGASEATDPVSEVFIYGPDLDGTGPNFPDSDTAPLGLVDVDAEPTLDLPKFLAEGVATDGDQWMYVTTRREGTGWIARYDISTDPSIATPPVLDSIIGLHASSSLRGITVATDGTLFLADKTRPALFMMDPENPAGAVEFDVATLPGVGPDIRPHHVTTIDVEGIEFLVVTDQNMRLLVVRADMDSFLNLSGDDYQVVDLSGVVDFDSATTGFGQIDYYDGTLYWTHEDSATVRSGGFDLVTDQILAIDVLGLGAASIPTIVSDLSSVVVPEPSTLAAVSVGMLLAARRRRSARAL